MEFRKYLTVIKGIRGMQLKTYFYARSLEDAKKRANEHIKKHYTKYWKMQIVSMVDMGAA